ncbi:MAG TPA: hypothetical protein VFQ51_03185 [Vicinamibacteria bacterium]|nr:hypothetical protein [Vicinamibacteria bacterium]
MKDRVFILSPASTSGERARIVMRDEARFDLALRLRSPSGAPLGEVFSFLSGLYFRGKLTYATAFAHPPAGLPAGVFVITPSEGLVPPEQHVDLARLRRFAQVPIATDEPRYRTPLLRDLNWLAGVAPEADVVLLGSIATDKYVEPLQAVFGDRVLLPADFAGRGDMSRGGLLLRCVEEGRELTYVPVHGAVRHGPRPQRLEPRVGILKRALERARRARTDES